LERLFGACAERVAVRRTSTWLAVLPALLRELLDAAPTHGEAAAAWLLTREAKAFQQARLESLRLPAIWLGGDKGADHSKTLMALFTGGAIAEAWSTRDDLIAFLTTGATSLPIVEAGDLLVACTEGRTPAAVRTLGLHALYRHVVDALERMLATTPRASDDWSIDFPLRCKCELCATLRTFLRDRGRVEQAWPLAEARRQHVQNVIGSHRLPVTYVTSRRGSPYSLVVTKQPALFDHEAASRARQGALLRSLKERRAAFVRLPRDGAERPDGRGSCATRMDPQGKRILIAGNHAEDAKRVVRLPARSLALHGHALART